MNTCIICKTKIKECEGNSITPLDFAFSHEEYIQLIKDDKLICCNKCNKSHIVPIRNMLHACNIPWNDKNIFSKLLVAEALMNLQEIYEIK